MYLVDTTDRLRELRGERTYREIADRAGVTPQAVQKWEKTGHVSRKSAQAYDDALGAGGEVMSLLGYTETGGASITTIDAKLDRILDLLENKSKPRRHRGDGTPSSMPRPALRPDR